MSSIANVCPWPLAGLLVGFIAVGLQWLDNLPLGATGAAAGFLDWASLPRRGPTWRALFFVGIALGAAIYAGVTDRWALSWSAPGLDPQFPHALGAKLLLLLGAGTLIGFGARWAGGCTSGHGICGVGRLQKGSLLATATFVGTAVLTAQLVWGLTGR
jgi:uncharacterized membrane protein YedE/YeeE